MLGWVYIHECGCVSVHDICYGGMRECVCMPRRVANIVSAHLPIYWMCVYVYLYG